MRIRSRTASSEPSWDLCVLSVVPKGFWGVGCHCHAALMEREPVNISLPLSFTTIYHAPKIFLQAFFCFLMFILSSSKQRKRKTFVTAQPHHAQGLCPLSDYPLFAVFWPSGESGAGLSLDFLEKRAFFGQIPRAAGLAHPARRMLGTGRFSLST